MLKPLAEMSPEEATEAFEHEILVPLLTLRWLDDPSSTGWDVLAVMYRMYVPDVPTQPEAVRALSRRQARALGERDLLELVGVLEHRLEASTDRWGRALADEDRTVVRRWCDEKTRGHRGTFAAVGRFILGDAMPDVLRAFRDAVCGLASSGELHRAPASPPGNAQPGARHELPSPPGRTADEGAAPPAGHKVGPPAESLADAETPKRRAGEGVAPPTGYKVVPLAESRANADPPKKGAGEGAAPPAGYKVVPLAESRADADQRKRLEAEADRSAAEAVAVAADQPPAPANEPATHVAAPVPDPEPELDLPQAVVHRLDERELRTRVERSLNSPAVDAAHERVVELPLAFVEHRIGERPGLLLVPTLEDGHEIWFVGDMHGDLLAFEAAMMLIEQQGRKDRTTVFLGDIIDDGFHSYELILRLFSELQRSPDRYLVLAGNHDEALRTLGTAPDVEFSSAVDPGQFAIWLNQQATAAPTPAVRADLVRIATIFIHFIARLPRALFLPHGLFAAHGGFPHKDLWDEIKAPESLTSKSCLGDFVWNRWTDYAAKLPNRMSTQSQFGARDFHGFRERAAAVLGCQVEAMVRGHDHISRTPERWERKEKVRRASYEGRVLTVNNLSYTMQREASPYSAKDPRRPTLARWRAGEDRLPTPVEIELPADLVDWYAPKCTKCGRPNATRASRCSAPADTASGICGTPMSR